MRLPRCITEGLRLRSAATKFNGFCDKAVQQRASAVSVRGVRLAFGSLTAGLHRCFAQNFEDFRLKANRP
jgi:hypothetical protein